MTENMVVRVRRKRAFEFGFFEVFAL